MVAKVGLRLLALVMALASALCFCSYQMCGDQDS